jgi:hypothetical protein
MHDHAEEAAIVKPASQVARMSMAYLYMLPHSIMQHSAQHIAGGKGMRRHR